MRQGSPCCALWALRSALLRELGQKEKPSLGGPVGIGCAGANTACCAGRAARGRGAQETPDVCLAEESVGRSPAEKALGFARFERELRGPYSAGMSGSLLAEEPSEETCNSSFASGGMISRRAEELHGNGRASAAPRSFCSRAPSVHFLKHYFLADVQAAGFSPDSTVYEIEEAVVRARGRTFICPRDGLLGAAYVDTLSGEDNVGAATHFLSYAWGNSVHDLVHALVAWQQRWGLDPRRTCVWLCCLCENLNRPRGQEPLVTAEALVASVGSRILGTGKVLALMGPWFAPLLAGRCWCLCELHLAVELLGQDGLEFLMSPREEEAFAEALTSGVRLPRILDSLAGVKLENAEVSFQDDRRFLLRLAAAAERAHSGGSPGWFNTGLVRVLQGGLLAIATRLDACREELTWAQKTVTMEEPQAAESAVESKHLERAPEMDMDPEWEKAFRIVDETTAEVSRIMLEARGAPTKQKQVLLVRKLLSSPQYSAALRYLEDPHTESERRCHEHYGMVDMTSVLVDVPDEMSGEPDDDGLELLHMCCVSEQSPLQSCQRDQTPLRMRISGSKSPDLTIMNLDRRLAEVECRSRNTSPCSGVSVDEDAFHL